VLGSNSFSPRQVADLNRDLSKRYGLPIDFSSKISSLWLIAKALSRGDIVHAQIATLHLQIPEPPPLAQAPQSTTQLIDLAKELHASGLLKADWNPSKHPRWPAGSPGGIGGEFAPADADLDAASADAPSASTRTAQAIPIPFEAVAPRGAIPWPSEIAPPLGIYPRRELVNPYPDREGCDEEWAAALRDCYELLRSKQLGRGNNRGSGRTFEKCVLGRVSERCGGNPTA
jgi:hypothetical protein